MLSGRLIGLSKTRGIITNNIPGSILRIKQEIDQENHLELKHSSDQSNDIDVHLQGTNEKIVVKVQWLNKYFLDKDVA